MSSIPAALIRISDLDIYRRFMINPERPVRLDIPGSVTISPAQIGWTSPNGAWKIVELREHPERPGRFFNPEEIERSIDGDILTITYIWNAWPQIEVDAANEADDDAELRRHLAKILFGLAKKIDPTLTKAQFRTWARSL